MIQSAPRGIASSETIHRSKSILASKTRQQIARLSSCTLERSAVTNFPTPEAEVLLSNLYQPTILPLNRRDISGPQEYVLCRRLEPL